MKQRKQNFSNPIIRAYQRRRSLQVMTGLAAIVIFITVYMLILPAITLERDTTCGKKEHQHTDVCYATSDAFLCDDLESTHQHTEDACYDDDGNLTCKEVEHVHNEECFPKKEIVCGKEEHQHNESCYPSEESTTEEGNDSLEEETQLPEEDPFEEVLEENDSFGMLGNSQEAAISDGDTGVILADGNITAVNLYYRTSQTDPWASAVGQTLPGNADLRLKVFYTNVSIDELLEADNTLIYKLSDNLRNPSAVGNIMQGSTVIGQVVADPESNGIKIIFKQTWLEEQRIESDFVDGDFFVESKLNLSNIDQENPGELVEGGQHITVSFEQDLIAQYGNVDLKKTRVEKTKIDDKTIEYTLTVTAGEDGAKDISVVDNFSDSSKIYIKEYGELSTPEVGEVYIANDPKTEGVIPQKADPGALEKPGTLVWKIGDMSPKQSVSFTYCVKLTDNFIGGKPMANLQNTAILYSMSYSRKEDTVNYKPTASATLKKTVPVGATKQDDGTYLVTYQLVVTAASDNHYTLKDVKVEDKLQKGVATYLPYVDYVNGSFHLYNGSNASATEDGNFEMPDLKDKKSFEYTIPSLAPGESKTICYQVRVQPGVLAAVGQAGKTEFSLQNMASVYASDKGDSSSSLWGSSETNSKIDEKKWSRKLAGEKVTEEKVIPTDTGSFTVPAGSQKYYVIVNEAGDWDLSSTNFKDNIDPRMQFVGSVRVDAYDLGASDIPNVSEADKTVLDKLKEKTPTSTKWVNVNNQESFQFQPKESLGFEKKGQAYLLTYYATPKESGENTQFHVANRFSLSGTAGIGGSPVELGGIEASVNVLIQENSSFSIEKKHWYYDADYREGVDFKKGAFYWAIKVDGEIPEGMQIKDTPLTSGTKHHIRGNSFGGAFIVDSSIDIKDYANMEAFRNNGTNPVEDASNLFNKSLNNSAAIFTANEKITLPEGKSLYIIVLTEPDSVPTGLRQYFTYKNSVSTSSDGSDWIPRGEDETRLYGSQGVFKESTSIITYSGSGTVTKKNGNINQIDQFDDINKFTQIKPPLASTNNTEELLNRTAGTYIVWRVQVNQFGNLDGDYVVTDTIPDGMEVAYMGIAWMGEEAEKNPPEMKEMESLEEGGWTAKQISNVKAASGNNRYNSLYYVNGNQVKWKIGSLQPGALKDKYAVEFEIACRVTKPEALLENKSGTSFNNHVSLETLDGVELGTHNNQVTLKINTLKKVGDVSVSGANRYRFTIKANPLGEDLIPNSDTLDIEDIMNEKLKLDISTITVSNLKSGNPINYENLSLSTDKRILTISGLPDETPLKIEYECLVDAKPEESVTISNQVKWKGYIAPENGSFEKNDFSYSVGGTAGARPRPKLNLRKYDQHSLTTLLPDATFTLQAIYKYNEAESRWDKLTDEPIYKKTTDSNGEITFGKDEVLGYNTIYKLVETVQPIGYLLDAKPRYFAIMDPIGETDNKTNIEDFPNDIEMTHAEYQNPEYTYEATNTKGSVKVQKAFRDASGKETPRIDGVYRFGLFQKRADGDYSKANYVQEVSITYANGGIISSDGESQDGTATFTGLQMGTPYMIFELDDKDKPITDSNQMAIVAGKQFKVSYQNNEVVVTQNQETGEQIATANVIVTNHVFYEQLPNTGGIGAGIFMMGGCFLAMLTFLYMIYLVTLNFTAKK